MPSLLSKYISPGCRVELRTIGRSKGKGGNEERKSYQSQLIDILSEDRVEIAMPVEKGKLVMIPIGREYDLYFYPDNKLYQCYVRVSDRYKNNNMYVLTLDLTSNLRKQQRREYYRFSCALEINSRQLGEAEEQLALAGKTEEILDSQLPFKKGVIVDISGGGLRFVANHTHEAQRLILCRYHLLVDGEDKEYNLIGKVLSVREVENREGLFEHRIQYVNVDAAQREEIIKFIFDQERKTLQKR